MKTAVMLLSGLLLAAFVSAPAEAVQVRVRVTARVNSLYDPGNVLAGKVAMGQRVTGTYVYNTNTPNLASDPNTHGQYRPYANEARVRFAIGSLVFESNQPTQGIEIYLQPNSSYGEFQIASYDNKPLANGTQVYEIRMEMFGQGNVTESTALPVLAPNLQQYDQKQVRIEGNSFSIYAELEVAELIVPDAIVVTPASGTFAANQHFDAAVILPRAGTVLHARATANGASLGLNYPGSCQLQPAAGATGRPSLLCPGADAALSLAPGEPILWTVEMTNGTVYSETVNWDRAP